MQNTYQIKLFNGQKLLGELTMESHITLEETKHIERLLRDVGLNSQLFRSEETERLLVCNHDGHIKHLSSQYKVTKVVQDDE